MLTALTLSYKRLGQRCMCLLLPTKGPPDLFEDDMIEKQQCSQRRLKVAILGAPNVGKSTLINKIIGHPVLCVSKRAHTTRQRERAAVIRDNTQIVFVDTPGLVSRAKLKRHKLDENFRKDGLRAVHESNLVGVIQDVADPYSRGKLDPNIMHILNNMGDKKSFLVLNKVDVIESKKLLLELIEKLTSRSEETEINEGGNILENTKIKPARSWPNFTEVFLVSALNGDGVSDLLSYLVKAAYDGRWSLPEGRVTERPWHVVLQELVRGRLLDALPHEIPYSLIIETEYFHENELGEVVAVVLVTCPVERYRRMLLSRKGSVIQQVAKLAEADARAALRTHVRLRIVVTAKKKNDP